jgi:predicted transcriptional regulator
MTKQITKKHGNAVYTPEIHNPLIIRLVKSGYNKSRIADFLGISRMSLHNWLDENPELADACNKAKEEINLVATDKIIEIIKSDDNKTALKAACFWLQSRSQDDWRNIQTIQVEEKQPKEMSEIELQEFVLNFAKEHLPVLEAKPVKSDEPTMANSVFGDSI